MSITMKKVLQRYKYYFFFLGGNNLLACIKLYTGKYIYPYTAAESAEVEFLNSDRKRKKFKAVLKIHLNR